MAEDDGRVVSNFIVQALRGQSLTVYGDGSQTRSFCFVSDLVRGILLAAFSNLNFNQPINLGNPNEYSMLELAEQVIKANNSNSKIDFHELPLDDPKQRKPNIEFAKEKLGWEPRINLKEGLKITSEYFENRITSRIYFM
jgi:UDP-glucuronate decarboxylase